MLEKWIWPLLAFLLLSACGAGPQEEESDSFDETCHLRAPVEDGVIPRVEGIKACFDAVKERGAAPLSGEENETFHIECSPSSDDSGKISLFASDKAGNSLSILSQNPVLGSGHGSYAASYGTYDAASQAIGAYASGGKEPEYDAIKAQWLAAKDGG